MHASVSHQPLRRALTKNFTMFYEDLRTNRLPQWVRRQLIHRFLALSFAILPLTHMHNILYNRCSSPPTKDITDTSTDTHHELFHHYTNTKLDSTSVTVAGQWARDFVTPLLNDKHFMNRTMVLITFDENETYPAQNRVFSILLGDAVPNELVGTRDPAYYSKHLQCESSY